MSDEPIELLRSSFAKMAAQLCAARVGEYDEARIAAVAAQLKPSVVDGVVVAQGPGGESADELFATLGTTGSAPPPGQTFSGDEDPRSWAPEKMQAFVRTNGHDAWRNLVLQAANRRQRSR